MLPILSTHAFGRSIILGQVVDAETGQPIEGVTVCIEWTKQEYSPPGLAGEVPVEGAETLTDSEGRFKIPKYSILLRNFRMAVYKNRYVCWSSRKIFPGRKKRKGFTPKNGMQIKLETFKETYSKEAHADFALTVSIRCREEYRKAIETEREIRGKRESEEMK